MKIDFYSDEDRNEIEEVKKFCKKLEQDELSNFSYILNDVIAEEFQTDDEPANRKYTSLIKKYLSVCTDAERECIDYTFMAICGWTLKTLLSKAKVKYEECEGAIEE